ncbi:hypothetical protein ACQVP2_06765 [Methylobacterium aquaticum]|uniref:hypothetical protein n=1 Tax=Methylobacterium aquaticum TaxID=270351 RepID=UPI003D169862
MTGDPCLLKYVRHLVAAGLTIDVRDDDYQRFVLCISDLSTAVGDLYIVNIGFFVCIHFHRDNKFLYFLPIRQYFLPVIYHFTVVLVYNLPHFSADPYAFYNNDSYHKYLF